MVKHCVGTAIYAEGESSRNVTGEMPVVTNFANEGLKTEYLFRVDDHAMTRLYLCSNPDYSDVDGVTRHFCASTPRIPLGHCYIAPSLYSHSQNQLADPPLSPI